MLTVAIRIPATRHVSRRAQWLWVKVRPEKRDAGPGVRSARVASRPTHAAQRARKCMSGVDCKPKPAWCRVGQRWISVRHTFQIHGKGALYFLSTRLLDVISFEAPDRSGESIVLDAAYVDEHLDKLAGNEDLSRYIL